MEDNGIDDVAKPAEPVAPRPDPVVKVKETEEPTTLPPTTLAPTTLAPTRAPVTPAPSKRGAPPTHKPTGTPTALPSRAPTDAPTAATDAPTKKKRTRKPTPDPEDYGYEDYLDDYTPGRIFLSKNGAVCTKDGDCITQHCDSVLKVCASPTAQPTMPTDAPTGRPSRPPTHGPTQHATCDDGRMNGRETASDCGGGECEPCRFGQQCLVGFDCESSECDPVSLRCTKVLPESSAPSVGPTVAPSSVAPTVAPTTRTPTVAPSSAAPTTAPSEIDPRDCVMHPRCVALGFHKRRLDDYLSDYGDCTFYLA